MAVNYVIDQEAVFLAAHKVLRQAGCGGVCGLRTKRPLPPVILGVTRGVWVSKDCVEEC